MRNKFNVSEDYREIIRKELPPGAFLKSDRGDGLFITNAQRFDPQFSGIQGFRTETRDGMTVIYPMPEHVHAFEDSCDEPAGDLSRSVYRFRAQKTDDSAVPLFSEGLKLIRSGTAPGIAAYDKRVRQHIAAALREGTVGGCYAISVLADFLNTPHKE